MIHRGQFQPGHKLSRGRPKGSKNKLDTDIFEAIEKVAEEKQLSLYEHFIRRAYEDDTVLIALMKKLLPNPRNEEQSDLSQRVIEMLNSDQSTVTIV